MNDDAFESICSRLESGQVLIVKVTGGRTVNGEFVRFESGGPTAGILVLYSDGQTLALSATQIDRIVPLDDTSPDTLAPDVLKREDLEEID